MGFDPAASLGGVMVSHLKGWNFWGENGPMYTPSAHQNLHMMHEWVQTNDP